MKLKLLIPLLMFFLISQDVFSCGRRLSGKMKVVDELNNPISNATVWRYSTKKDSSKVRKYSHRKGKEATEFYIFHWYYFSDDKRPDKEYLITAEGYANVILKNIEFIWERGDTITPTLVITMYGQKYKKVNNSIALYDKFIIDEIVEVKDTVRLKWKDYVGDEDDINNGFGKEAYTKVTTYPNPVVKGLHIKINYDITSPLTAKISDVQGKLIEEIRIENNEVDWDLQWHKKGSYFLTVYDETNKPIHTQLIAKQ